jgi:hypothetical protein
MRYEHSRTEFRFSIEHHPIADMVSAACVAWLRVCTNEGPGKKAAHTKRITSSQVARDARLPGIERIRNPPQAIDGRYAICKLLQSHCIGQIALSRERP